MSNNSFCFKQFTVTQERCAMKVGTDGALLGAWARVEQAKRVLDVGTGTGLIALMSAQRSAARVVGVEIESEAAAEARENVLRSPWSNRIEIVCSDIRHYQPDEQFDAILSNPPFFVRSLTCPQKSRTLARHSEALSCKDLLLSAKRLLKLDGELSLVLPANRLQEWVDTAGEENLFLVRRTWVHTKIDIPPKRVLLSFGFVPKEPDENELVIESSTGCYSKEFKELLHDFYLKL